MDLLGPGLSLAEQVFKFVNTKMSMKYINELVSLRQDILEEENKGYDSDDAKLETLYKQAQIIQEAAKAQLSNLQAQKPTDQS